MGDYRKYVASKDWKQMRDYRIALAGGRCEECGASRVLQAHHNTYARVGREQLDDLDVLCRPCHMREHGTQPKERPMSATNGVVTETTVETAPATVTIRTLSVHGSSMTLAVYRQLPESELINNGKFYGTPWGTVNLCPSRDCPENERSHLHVVFESDGQLYRDVCLKPEKFWPYHSAASSFATLLATHGETRVGLTCERALLPGSFEWGRRFLQRFAEDLPPLECYVLTDSDVLMAHAAEPPCNCLQPPDQNAGKHDYACDQGNWIRAYDELVAEADKVCAKWEISHPLELARIIETDLREDVSRHAALIARWEELEQLPQLFLGV